MPSDTVTLTPAPKTKMTTELDSERTIGFYIEHRIELGSPGRTYHGDGPKHDQSGYEFAKIPKWQLLRWRDEIEALRKENEALSGALNEIATLDRDWPQSDHAEAMQFRKCQNIASNALSVTKVPAPPLGETR